MGREKWDGGANKGFLPLGEGREIIKRKGREVRRGDREGKERGHVHCQVLMPCKADDKIYAKMHDSSTWILLCSVSGWGAAPIGFALNGLASLTISV